MTPTFIYNLEPSIDFACPSCGKEGCLKLLETLPEENRFVDDILITVVGVRLTCKKCKVVFEYYVPEEVRPAGKV